MNPWPIYSHIKRTVQRTGKFPTNREVVAAFPGATHEDIREGIIEAHLAYDRAWKHELLAASQQSRGEGA